MKCADPSTRPEPSTEYTCEDAGYGAVRVRAWSNFLHPRRSGLTKAAGQPRAFAPSIRDVGVGGGGATASRREAARAARPVAVVAWPRRTGSRLSLESLHIRRLGTWSIPYASSNRLWDGPRLGGTPSRAGRPVVDVAGDGAAFTQLRLARRHARCGSAAALGASLRHRPPDPNPGSTTTSFRRFWWRWVRPPSRRNPADGLRGGPKAAFRAGRNTTRPPSRRPPKPTRIPASRRFAMASVPIAKLPRLKHKLRSLVLDRQLLVTSSHPWASDAPLRKRVGC